MWGIWIVLTGIIALSMSMVIVIGFTYLPKAFLSPTEEIYIAWSPVPAYYAIFAIIIGTGLWVLFLGNVYIGLGLNKLGYTRWKLLVIESALMGIVISFMSLNMILNFEFALQPLSSLYKSLQTGLAALLGTGFWLGILYLAFSLRDQFKKT